MTTDNIIHTIQPSRPDSEIAAEARVKARKLLQEICDVMNQAQASGLTLNFQVARDTTGRYFISSLSIVREF